MGSSIDRMKRRSSCRSVNDFSSVEALRSALQSMGHPSLSSQSADTAWGSGGVISSPRVNVNTSKIDAIVPFIHSQPMVKETKISKSDDDEAAVKVEMEFELRRLAVLKSYRLIESGKNSSYERLLSLTSRIFDAPISYVSVLDLSKQHVLAARGLGAMATAAEERCGSLCSMLVEGDSDIVVILDLFEDSRFKDHENVRGLPYLRFFAATPLICPEGVRLGSLCVLDTEPRPEGLSLDMKQNLREIADMVVDAMVEEREKRIFEYRQPSRTIACTSNDLMAPLRGVVEGLSAIGQDKQFLPSLSAQQKEVFNTAFACSTVMTRICQKSVDSAYLKPSNQKDLEADSTKKSKENLLRIEELVQDLHLVMDPFPKQVPLVVTVFDEVPHLIVADELKVFRSVVNYLTNACANTEKGSVHLKVFIQDDEDDRKSMVDEQPRVVFLVEDTGSGIGVDQYRLLFKPVASDANEHDSSCTLASFGDSINNPRKTGLGLFSVATQIGSIGGEFGFRPRGFDENGLERYDENGAVLEGSIFWFSIPLILPEGDTDEPILDSARMSVAETQYDVDDDTTHDKRKWNADDEYVLEEGFSEAVSLGEKRTFNTFVGRPTSRKKKALVIDDSLTTRRTISRMLKKLDFDVSEAVNGLEGLHDLQANLYDLVLCDFLMPVMEGSDCVQQYREYEVMSRPWFDQYIVGISAHANEGDVERGMKVGMNDYLSKPVTMTHLEEILQEPEFKYVSARLDSIMANIYKSDESLKLPKILGGMEASSPQNEQVLKVCLVVEDGQAISTVSERIAEVNGWRSVIVRDGDEALRLLQMRNWDVVLVDDSLPGLPSCVLMELFRDWEKNNRVNRQKNVYQVSSCFAPSHLGTSSTVQLPKGFDGALGKPVSVAFLEKLLQRSVDGKNCMSHDIVRR